MRIFGWTFLLFLLSSTAIARTFTNREGRAVEGEILGVDAKTVTLKVNGKSFAVPIEGLIQSDQDYIRSWVEKEKSDGFEISAAITEEAESRVSKRSEAENIVESKQKYELRLKNRTGTAAGPLTVKYNIITLWETTSKETDKTGIDSKSAYGVEPGSIEVSLLPDGEETILHTDPVPVKTREWTQRWTTFNANSQVSGSQWDDYTEKVSLEGVRVRVYSGEQMILEWSEGRASRDDVKWSDTQVIANADLAAIGSPALTDEDLEPVPPVPGSLRKDRNVAELHLQVLNAATTYSNMKYREEKKGDLRDQKKLFKSLLDRYRQAIGGGSGDDAAGKPGGL